MTRTPWHRLTPLTRLVIATATIVTTVLLGGVLCPLVLALFLVFAPAVVAGEVRAVVRATALLSLPLVISVAIVNIFLFTGGTTLLLELGPLTVTAEGVALAAAVVVRVLVMAAAVTLFYRTTRPAELVADLEGRGAPPRVTFVIHNAVAMVPRLATRAAEVTAAQRARGLETERGAWQRARGTIALAAPTVLGAIEEGEARTMAMEARGFGRGGPRTLLWQPRDRGSEPVVRWVIVLAVAGLALARVVGLSLPC